VIFFSKTNYSTDYFIPLGLTFSTSLPQLSEKISFLLTTQFSKHYYYGFIETKYYSGTDNNYIHVHLLKPGLIGSFKYTFPKGKIRPSVALGGGHSFVFNSKSKRIQEAIWGTSIKTTEIKDIPIPPGLTIFTGSLGVDFKLFNNNPFFFNANYSLELGRLNKTETSIQEVGFKLGTYF